MRTTLTYAGARPDFRSLVGLIDNGDGPGAGRGPYPAATDSETCA